MREAGMAPQCILTLPLLVGLDGVHKMSKSLGNYIGITEPPSEIFGKAMSVPDAMMRDYLVLTLAYPEAEAERLAKDAAEGRLHPRELKARIAGELVARYHGAEAAEAARAGFDRLFVQKETPETIEEMELATREGKLGVLEILAAAGLAASNSEARRLIRGGGVKLDGEKVEDDGLFLAPGEYLFQAGKRRFKRIRLT
jgi:tyrosyl-tRNA synthetase